MAKRSTLDLGHDAFLDIVANLVGILIILLAIVGSQSAAAIRQAAESVMPPVDTGAVDQPIVDEETVRAQWRTAAEIATRSAAAQSDSDRLESMVRRYDQLIDTKKQTRDRLLDLLAVAKEAWRDAQQNVEATAVAAAQRSVAIQRAESELADLQIQIDSAQTDDTPPAVIQHLPTPMAKAVFHDEIHIRIKDNRISIVPLDRLLDEIETQVQRGGLPFRDGRTTDSAGPHRGYIARYAIDRHSGTLSRGRGARRAVQIQMAGVIVTPLREPFGDDLATAVAPTGALSIELAGRDPARTTLTAWVYPDSFETFNRLKQTLYAAGFTTAARPLDFDMPIGVSPQGSRSQAQ